MLRCLLVIQEVQHSGEDWGGRDLNKEAYSHASKERCGSEKLVGDYGKKLKLKFQGSIFILHPAVYHVKVSLTPYGCQFWPRSDASCQEYDDSQISRVCLERNQTFNQNQLHV